VGKDFFALLSTGGGGGSGANSVDLATQVNQFRVAAEDLVKRARKLDVPNDMKPAQANLVLALELRRDALRKIAEKIPTALAKGNGDQAGRAVAQITGQMRAFDASDVIYSQRVIPYIQRALDDAGVGGQTIPTSQFLPNLTWLDEAQVASRLGASASARSGGPVAPGSHGHGLTSVSVAGTDLVAGGDNQIPAGANLSFTVKFMNQGENDETAVGVRLTITGAGKTINAQKTVAQTTKGQEASVDIPLTQAPPVGNPVTITVEIQPVPGEKMTDNNKATYQATFTR
jgi:hypothetical protein